MQQVKSRVVIIGGGPSGLVVGNYLKLHHIPFILFDGGKHQFIKDEVYGVKFHNGQRTMFYNSEMEEFLKNCFKYGDVPEDLSDSVIVHYKDKEFTYPIQNAKNLPFGIKCNMYWSYLFRNKKLANNNNFVDWVKGTYGKYLAENVILPHTWKTIKEDLWLIDANAYGKKVQPMNIFGEKKMVLAFSNQEYILVRLRNNIEEYIVTRNVKVINESYIEDNYEQNSYDIIINTIALPRLFKLLNGYEDIIDASVKSLCYNDMLIINMVVPKKFLNTDKNIIYFPERNYIFSKVNINRNCEFAVISVEISFRMNEKEKLNSLAYINKVYEKVENDLKKAKILPENLFVALHREHKIVSPAYIICDQDYMMNNTILQSYLTRHNIYNIGRFAEWNPNLRIEHSLQRIKQLVGNVILQNDKTSPYFKI